MTTDMLRDLCGKAGIKIMGDRWVLTTVETLQTLVELSSDLPRCTCGSIDLIECDGFFGCNECGRAWEGRE